jgi:hypothetical protein
VIEIDEAEEIETGNFRELERRKEPVNNVRHTIIDDDEFTKPEPSPSHRPSKSDAGITPKSPSPSPKATNLFPKAQKSPKRKIDSLW